MPQPITHISEKQWLEAVDCYERGTKHAAQIARELGVSPATVCRQFKRRGCVKGSRVAEVIAPLQAGLDRQARKRALLRRAQEEAAMKRVAANDRLIDEMMLAIVMAARADDLSKAAVKVKEVGASLGVKLSR